MHPLEPFFHPRSVAVIGASGTPNSVGHILLRNLLTNPFGGVVYPVNPRHHAVQGVRAYPSIPELPEAVDLAVIATPASTVPEQIEACANAGIPAAIIISAGFSETGPQGLALQSQVRLAARDKLRIVGPNCLGIIHPPSNFNASFAASMARPGSVALLSQSGAICTSILDWSHTARVGFSSFVSVGSMIDVDFADLIDYFGDDPKTRSIVIYMESVGDVRSFLSSARAVARAKPIVVVKSGRVEAAARAAASHTGALAGSDDVFDAALRRAGVLRVQTIRDLFNMSEILASQPQPPGPALGILTNAGGPGVMATDALIGSGGVLADLSAETSEALNRILPQYWSHANPIDILGDATPDRYRLAAEACLRDDKIEGLLVLLTPQAMTDPTKTAQEIAQLARGFRKPLLAAWMGAESVFAGRAVLREAGVPTFDTPESAVRAFLHMVQYRQAQELLYETPESTADVPPTASEPARKLVQELRSAGRKLLTEDESKSVLTAYGIPVTRTIKALTADEAIHAAETVKYPVVLKLLSTAITHKTEAGGVVLNIADASGVKTAYQEIRKNAVDYALHHGILEADAFQGVTVQPFVSGRDAYELILGSSVDRQFGPVILFGSGGTLVEVYQDRCIALPPLNRTLARRLMERTRIFPALQGIRGRPGANIAELESILVRLSQLVMDLPEIAEIDINPLLVGPSTLIALDARVVLLPPNEPLPKPAILPYPSECITSWVAKNGIRLTIRPIQPEDEPLIVAMHGRHSENTIRMRYFSLVGKLSRERLIRLCHLDYNRELALVAIQQGKAGEEAVGVSRYHLDPSSGEAEFGITVTDSFQGQGLGKHLMSRLIEVARERGISTLSGLILAENRPMLGLMKALGFEIRPTKEITVVEARLPLKP